MGKTFKDQKRVDDSRWKHKGGPHKKDRKAMRKQERQNLRKKKEEMWEDIAPIWNDE